MIKQDKVGAQISLIKIPINTPIEFNLDSDTDWVRDFLLELNENIKDKTPEILLEETSLYIMGEIEKKDRNDMGEYLIAKGHIEATYQTECVRTLKPMTVELDVPFKICFVDESLATTELFEGLDETYVDNDVFELYYYTKRTVEFSEMIHEQIFLNYDQYPVLDAEAKLEGVETHK